MTDTIIFNELERSLYLYNYKKNHLLDNSLQN